MFTRDRITGEQTIQVYEDFKQYSLGYQCKGLCEHHELKAVGKRYKGYTQQEEGIRRCKRCSVNWKPEVVELRCPCCNQRLSGRVKSKQSRRYREMTQSRVVQRCYRYVCTECDYKTDNQTDYLFHGRETRHRVKDIPLEYIIISAKPKEETNVQKHKL